MKNYEQKMFIIGSLLGFCFFVTSCTEYSKTPPLPPIMAMEVFTSKVDAHIYVDATLSMIGFVKPGPNTRYCKTIEALEGTVISGWAHADVEFFKFGDEILPLEGREYIRAKEPNFYSDSKINRITRIQQVIDRIKTSDISLVLTDLFQNKSDVNLLTKKLKEKCFLENLTFGILGIRSEFNGYIYDLGPNRPSAPYRSKSDESTFRPFYIIMMGKYVDVIHFYEQFKTSGLDFDVDEFLVYSPYLTNQPVTFADAMVDSTDHLSEARNLIPFIYFDPRVKQFRLNGDPEVATFVSTFSYSPAEFSLQFDHKSIDFEISATQCLPDTFFSNSQAAKALTFPDLQISEDKIAVRAELRPTLLPGDGLFYYEVVIRPKPMAYQFPVWINEWDMEKSISNGSGKKKVSVGPTTLNLHRLLVDLWRSNLVVHKPRLATLYFYFEKS